MTKFEEVKQYFGSEKRNSYFLTRDFYKKFGQELNSYSTYKCYFRAAGYIVKVDNGLYKKVKNFPKDITIKQLYTKAYG